MDLFVVPTIGFNLLCVLVIVRLARRELVWINVTAYPTAEWIARQATFDRRFGQSRCEKGERDRHGDLADAAFFACGDLLDIGDGARNDFIEPAPATGDRRDELSTGVASENSIRLTRGPQRITT